jgi:microcystin-dependent protein
MKRTYLSALAALSFASSAFACGDGDYIGSICTTAANFCPANTTAANGQLLPISQNQALYSVIGSYFGGDGITTFALPDLRGRATVEYGSSSPTGLPVVKVGAKRGSESVVLTTAQMPQHTHSATFTPGNGTNPITVNVPINPAPGSSATPSMTMNYLAGSPNNTTGGNMWSSPPATSPTNLGGITVSGNFSKGTVTLAPTGVNKPIALIPPQLGLNYCVVTSGTYPKRP